VEINENGRPLQLILALSVKQLVRPIVIGFRYEHFGRTIQITIVRRGRINELLRRSDAVFLQHHDEHLRVDHRPGIKKFHTQN